MFTNSLLLDSIFKRPDLDPFLLQKSGRRVVVLLFLAFVVIVSQAKLFNNMLPRE